MKSKSEHYAGRREKLEIFSLALVGTYLLTRSPDPEPEIF